MELHWLLKEIPQACRNINLTEVNFVIHTDGSQTGWGVADGNNLKGGKLVRKPRVPHQLYRTESHFLSR